MYLRVVAICRYVLYEKKRNGPGRAFSLTLGLAYCYIHTSEIEEQLNSGPHDRAD